MNPSDILGAYDQAMRIDAVIAGMRRERDGGVVRYVDMRGTESVVVYSSADAGEIDGIIDAQINYFETLGHNFEWKVFDHDSPSDLKERLAKRGFTIEEPEALVVLDLANPPKSLLLPQQIDVRRITLDCVDDFRSVLLETWSPSVQHHLDRIVESAATLPELVSLYVAYDSGKPVSCGWINFTPSKRFAGLWSGSTLPEFRGRGFYRAIVAARVQEAGRRGARFAAVDAKPTSRPILQKLGFQLIGQSHECMWKLRS